MDRPNSGSLPQTDWALIERARTSTPEHKRQALQAIVRRYLPALHAHVIARFGVTTDRADDLLQEFLSVKVLAGGLIEQARQERGKFRYFLCKTLDDFIVSQIRWENRQKRAPEKFEEADSGLIADDGVRSPLSAFELTWAREVVAEAIEKTAAECRQTNRSDLWGIFEERVLRPSLEGTPPLEYSALVQQYGFGSPEQAANALVTAKRMLKRNLEAVLQEYSEEDAEPEDSIDEIRAILAGSR